MPFQPRHETSYQWPALVWVGERCVPEEAAFCFCCEMWGAQSVSQAERLEVGMCLSGRFL